MALPANINSDTLPVVLINQLGLTIPGDFRMSILAEGFERCPLNSDLATATLTAAANANLSAADATTLINLLTKYRALK